MQTATVKAPPIGTGSVRSVFGTVTDLLNGLGTVGTAYLDNLSKVRLYEATAKQATSASKPIADSNDERKLVSAGMPSTVSTEKLLLVGGGILAGGLLLFTLFRKK